MKYLSIICLFLTTQLVHAQSESYQTNEILVQLDKSVNPEEWIKEHSDIATFSIQQVVSKRLGIYRLSFVEHVDAKTIARKASSTHGVLVSQVNHTGVSNRATPNDQSYSQQWSFNTTAPGVSNAPQAWDFTTGGFTTKGDRIVVAVIDGGFYTAHEDLNFYTNTAEIPGNGIDDDNNGYIDDVQGWNASNQTGNHPTDNHGTHVSGIVGAKGNNGIGVTGVNWDVDVLPITSTSAVESDVLIAYNYALDMRARYNETNGAEGAYVVATNSSFGIDFGNPANFPLWCAFYDSLGAYGILSAGATANLGINIDVTGDIPTACPSDYLVAVTNTTISATKNGGAAYGATQIDLGAPGTNIYNTFSFQNYGMLTGTSMATPMVAGTIGLMHSILCENYYEEYDGREDDLALHLKDILLATVTPQTDIQNLTVSGGRLNIFRAIDSLRYFNCIQGTEIAELDSCGDCNGSATVQISLGEQPYSFNWSTGSTDSVLVACQGNYTLTVTDNFGFQEEFTVTIDGNNVLEANAIVTDAVNGTNGSISLNPSGANAGMYAYQWSTGETTSSINGLSEGTYSVTISSGSCQLVESYEIDSNDSDSTGGSTGVTNLRDAIDLRVYPNPASSRLVLQASEDLFDVTMLDLSGRIVLQQSQTAKRIELHVDAVTSGVYLLSVKTSAGGEILTKVTIQH